ncbi:MAG: thioredoxin family protein, partial [Akkermansiaceae bacterium]
MRALQQTIITLVLILTCSGIANASGWTTNLESALASAKKSKKFVLAQFTGSDWCPPCMMIHDKVFSKSAFTRPVS